MNAQDSNCTWGGVLGTIKSSRSTVCTIGTRFGSSASNWHMAQATKGCFIDHCSEIGLADQTIILRRCTFQLSVVHSFF